MAQTSYGTITITDTTDIERIYVVYAKSINNTDAPTAAVNTWTESITQAPGSGNYIWQRMVIAKSGIVTPTYGNPVCITGPEGEAGRHLASTTTEYTVATNAAVITTSNMNNYTWSCNVPAYNSNYPSYWVRITNIYADSADYTESYGGEVLGGEQTDYSNTTINETNTIYIIYKDEGISGAIAVAENAASIAADAAGIAEGAATQAGLNIRTITRIWNARTSSSMISAPNVHITESSDSVYNQWTTSKPTLNSNYPYYFYCDEFCTGGGNYNWSKVILDTSLLSQYQINALDAKVKNFWWDSSGAHVASGKNGNEVTTGSISTYGYHALMGLTGIRFGYDNAKVVDLDSTIPAVRFYQPPTINGNVVTEGKLTMSLANNSLMFLNPTNGSTVQAELNSTGLKLIHGGIEAGTKNTNNYIYVWSEDDSNHALTIGNSSTNKTDWRIVAGNKFGVDKAGNLYASNANISGTIVVAPNSDSNVPTKDEMTSAINDIAIGGKSVHTLMSSNTTGADYVSILTWTAEGYNTSWEINTTATPLTNVKIGDTCRVAYKVSNMGTSDNRPYVYVVGEVTNKSSTNITMTMHGLDTTIIDGGNIITNSIGANQIAANSISAMHMTLSDSTNLATVNEQYTASLPTDLDASYQAAISGGYLTKKVATQTYLMLTDYPPNSFKQNDELYYEFYGKAATAGTVTLSAWGYTGTPPAHTYSHSNGVDISLTTSEAFYSGTLKLSAAGWANATTYLLGFGDNRDTKSQIYVRKVVIRRKYAGELIVDGSITANHMTANSITIGNMDSNTAGKVNNGDSALSKVNYYNRTCHVGNSSNTQTNLWRKFASYTETRTNADPFITFDVMSSGDMSNLKRSGRLKAHVRTSGTAGTVDTAACTLQWINHSEGITLSDFVLAYKATSGTDVKIELWCRCPTSWVGYRFNMVEEGDRTSTRSTAMWTMYDSFTADGVASITSGYTQVASTEIDAARTTATNYIYADSSGIRIASANPSTQNQRLTLTSSEAAFYTSDNVKRLTLNSSDGVIAGLVTKGHTVVNDNGLMVYDSSNTSIAELGASLRIGTSTGQRVQIKSDGVYIYNQSNVQYGYYGSFTRVGDYNDKNVRIDSDGVKINSSTDSVIALFGATARVGPSNTRHIEIKDGGLQVYQNSSSVMAHIGYGLGNSSSGTANAAYYSFGPRKSGTEVGNYSLASGLYNEASGYISHAEGYETAAIGKFGDHAEGYKTTASGSYGAHAEGYQCVASHTSAHAEGESTVASGSSSHAEGAGSQALATNAHAEGDFTTVAVNADHGHAEGYQSTVTGKWGCHAEGYMCTASGDYGSHAEGYHCTASGDTAHAGGYYTIAAGDYQTVIGRYNASNTSSLFIVGYGGNNNSRSNAFEITGTGSVYVGTQLVHSSDRRLKTHISYLGDESVNFINKLKPAYYIKDGGKHVGFYAQDVAEIDKWDCMIGEEMNGYMTLSYMDLIAPLVKYCQHLEKRIEQLENKI